MVGRTGHTRTRVLQCSLASVGLAQARPNNTSNGDFIECYPPGLLRLICFPRVHGNLPTIIPCA